MGETRGVTKAGKLSRKKLAEIVGCSRQNLIKFTYAGKLSIDKNGEFDPEIAIKELGLIHTENRGRKKMNLANLQKYIDEEYCHQPSKPKTQQNTTKKPPPKKQPQKKKISRKKVFKKDEDQSIEGEDVYGYSDAKPGDMDIDYDVDGVERGGREDLDAILEDMDMSPVIKEQARKIYLERQHKIVDLKAKLGEMIEKKFVERAVKELAATLMERLTAIPSRNSAILAAEVDPRRCEQVLDEEIRIAIDGIHSFFGRMVTEYGE